MQAIMQIGRQPAQFLHDHLTITILGYDEDGRVSYRTERNDGVEPTDDDMALASNDITFILSPRYGPQQ
jgi:hypothetical protein